MTIRQCAGLEPMHQDIKLCGWERATAREVLEAKHPLICIDMAKRAVFVVLGNKVLTDEEVDAIRAVYWPTEI